MASCSLHTKSYRASATKKGPRASSKSIAAKWQKNKQTKPVRGISLTLVCYSHAGRTLALLGEWKGLILLVGEVSALYLRVNLCGGIMSSLKVIMIRLSV